MGKIEDMRRMREASFAGDARPAAPKSSAGAAATSKVPARGAGKAVSEEQGRCSECGKVRALDRGLVSAHQKGLGKACPGSRRPPA